MPPDDNGQDLAGYPSVEELVKAYRASGTEAQRLRSRVTELEQQAPQQRQPVPQRDVMGRFVSPGTDTPEDELRAYGVPVEALGRFMGTAIQRAFEPIAQAAGGRTVLLGKYPDYNKYEADVAAFVNTDPEVSTRYQKMFQSDPVGAMEYAFLKFGQVQASRQQPRTEPTNGNGDRSHAQLPNTQGGAGVKPPEGNADDQVRAGYDFYQKTGNPTAFAKARLRQVISKDFLER